MVAFVLIHLFLMHYATAPSATGAAFVGGRWRGAGWRAFDWTLLVLALTHGVVGVQGMLREVIRRPAVRAALDVTAAAIAVGFAGVGTVAVMAAPLSHHGGIAPEYAWIPSVLVGGLVVIATATYLAVVSAGMGIGLRVARREPIGRWHYPGQWAFALNRAAGAGILGFLLVHVLDVALFPLAPDLYDQTVRAYSMPYLIPMEVGLVAAVLYHALDGLRLIALEILDRRATTAGGPSFVAVLALTVGLSLPALAVLLGWRR